MRNNPAERWARWFGRFFPPALAPLSILLLLSLRVRIADYGWTEERYIGVVAALWIFGWAMLFTFRRAAGIRWIPASLAVIALLVGYGPWSAGAVSKRSQTSRTIALLSNYNLWNGNSAQPAGVRLDLPHDDGVSLRSNIQYLASMHGEPTLRSLFGHLGSSPRSERSNGWGGANAIIEALNINIAKDELSYRSYARSHELPMDVSGFRRAWPETSVYRGKNPSGEPRTLGDLQVGFEDGELKAWLNGSAKEVVPLTALVAKLPLDGQLDAAQSQLDFTVAGRAFRIFIISMSFDAKAAGGAPTAIQFILLER